MRPCTLDTLHSEGYLNAPAAAFLRALVRSRQSIAFTGQADTGKTTLLNACLAECDPHDRLAVCEDSPELERLSATWTYAVADRREMAYVVRDSLRRRPNRLVVGEVRDSAMYAVLDSVRTGSRPGRMFTLDVGDPSGVQARIESLVRLATPFLRTALPTSFIAAEMAAGLDFVVAVGKVWDSSDRHEPGWLYRLLSISEVRGVEDSTVELHAIFQFDPDTLQAVWTGSNPRRLAAIQRACPDFMFKRDVELAR